MWKRNVLLIRANSHTNPAPLFDSCVTDMMIAPHKVRSLPAGRRRNLLYGCDKAVHVMTFSSKLDQSLSSIFPSHSIYTTKEANLLLHYFPLNSARSVRF